MPNGAASKARRLFRGRVGGVVGGDDVHGPVLRPFGEGGDVGGGPQGRVHLEIRIARPERLVGEEEMVGRGLGRDADAAGLGLADQADSTGGGEMGDVDAGPEGLGQDDVAGDHDVLRRRRACRAGRAGPTTRPSFIDAAFDERRVLAVVDDQASGRRGRLQGPAHEPAVGTGRPSSEKATAPAATRSAMSTSSLPAEPSVTAAIGRTLARPARPASARILSVDLRRSLTGGVLGMAQTVVKPPRTAARAPVSIVSLASSRAPSDGRAGR